MPTNIEFKVITNRLEAAEQQLLTRAPRYVGEDHQIDTYFNVATGRLKLREGNIEHSLIYYERENTSNVKQSNVILYNHQPDKHLKALLEKVHGIKTVVDKKRKIYFIDNVKFHFDRVEGLGTFIEVEAIDTDGTISIEKLQEQCNYYAQFLGVREDDYLAVSYSDMILYKSN
jgi:predicted adenylyl cyclase CyaB